MKNLSKTLLLLSTVGLAAQAEVRINGFANLIGGITSSDDSLYGYEDDISFNSESLFALQVSGDINDKMTATGQIVARGQNDYDAEFEWAYLTFNATDNISISAGRLRLPLFKYSASKDVGYSYHWVNAPRAVYDVPFNNLDGLRVDYADYAGDWEYNLQLALGQIDSEIAGGDLIGKNVVLVTGEVQRDWFKARAVAGRAKSTLTGSAFDAPISQLATFAPQLADDLSLSDDTAVFIGLGLDADFSDWFVSAEFTSIDTKESFSPKDQAYYITAGMRIDALTPSITYEKLDGQGEIRFIDKVASLPAAAQPTAGFLVTATQQAAFAEYEVVTLGLRYDMDTNVALKADISRYTSDVATSGDANLLRVAINYVF